MFHPSCLERKKSIKIGGYKIYCSHDCQVKDLNSKEKLANYVAEIEHLKDECQERDAHIKRLNRQSQQFESDVVDAEKNYTGRLLEQGELIGVLQKQKAELEARVVEFSLKMSESKEVEERLREKLAEMSEINRNMLTSISTLEQESKACYNELMRAKCALAEYEKRSHYSQAADEVLEGISVADQQVQLEGTAEKLDRNAVVDMQLSGSSDVGLYNKTSNSKSPGRRKILFVGGAHLSGFLPVFRKYMVGSSVFGFVKPYALNSEYVKTAINESRGFTKKDVVVIWFDGGGYQICISDYIDLFPNCRIILVTSPYTKDDRQNTLRYKFNIRLYRDAVLLSRQFDVRMFDSNHGLNTSYGRFGAGWRKNMAENLAGFVSKLDKDFTPVLKTVTINNNVDCPNKQQFFL